MSPRIRGWALAGSAALVVAVLAMHIVWPQPGQDEDYWAWPLGLMAFPVAAALILAKRPGNGVGRIMGVVALAALANFASWWYVGNYPTAPLSDWADLVSALAVLVQFGGMIGLLYVFPTGRPYNHIHRWVLRGFVAAGSTGLLLWLVSPGPLPTTEQPNPAGVLPEGARSVASNLWDSSLAVFSVLGVVFLVLRWRHAGNVERLQLRWFVSAALAAIVALFLAPDDDLDVGPFIDIVGGVVLAAAIFWSLPAAIVIAVTRYRLYEIDRLLSRTVSYALVVGSLAAMFVTIAIGVPQLLPVTLDSSLLVAVATLAVAAMFNPVRRRVQDVVDRRFNRVRYNTQQEMDRLARRLRTELDLGDLADEVLNVVSSTMQPTAASVWIREGQQ